MSRFQIKPGLPFYLFGLAGKGDMFSCGYLCNLHTFGLNLRTYVAIYDILSQSTHFCCNFCNFVTIYAFLSWCQRFCDLRVLGAKKNCESWVPSQKNRISSHGQELHLVQDPIRKAKEVWLS